MVTSASFADSGTLDENRLRQSDLGGKAFLTFTARQIGNPRLNEGQIAGRHGQFIPVHVTR